MLAILPKSLVLERSAGAPPQWVRTGSVVTLLQFSLREPDSTLRHIKINRADRWPLLQHYSMPYRRQRILHSSYNHRGLINLRDWRIKSRTYTKRPEWVGEMKELQLTVMSMNHYSLCHNIYFFNKDDDSSRIKLEHCFY